MNPLASKNSMVRGKYCHFKILENTKNSYLRSENRLIVGIDLNDLIVVETKDAILISNKKSSQKVKNVVSYLKSWDILMIKEIFD